MRLRHIFLHPSAAALLAAAALASAGSAATPAVGLAASQPARPSGAFKHLFRARGTRPLAATPFSSTADLHFNGGHVAVLPAVYLTYWGSQWQSGFSTGGYTSFQAQNYLNTFFSGVGGTNWLNTTTQYCQGISAGSVACSSSTTYVTNPSGQLKGVWTDGGNAVPTTPTDTDINNEVRRANAHFGVNADAVYIIFTPSGHSESGFGTQWCGWHGFNTGISPAPYAYIPYQPDAGGACGVNFINKTDDSFGHGYFDGFSVVAGHEYAESITDPFPSSGWVDPNNAEIGDKCAWSSTSADLNEAGAYFAFQPLWSNQSAGCSLGTAGYPSGSTRLGGSLPSAPDATASEAAGRLDVVTQGYDSTVWDAVSTDGGKTYSWRDLGGYAQSAPTIVGWPGHLEVFVTGWNRQIYHSWWNGTAWSGWYSLGGTWPGAPSAASWGPGRMDVVARGWDGKLYHDYYDGAWHTWQSVATGVTDDPSVVSSQAGQVEVFWRGYDEQVWHHWYIGGAWRGYSSLGGTVIGSPEAVSWGSGRVDVFARGTNYAAWHNYYDPATSWHTWNSEGGDWTSDPGAAALGSGSIDLFLRGTDGALWQDALTGIPA